MVRPSSALRWLFLWVLFLGVNVLADEVEPAQRLQAKMSPIHTLTSGFSQRTLGPDNQLLQSSQGQLWLSPGGRFKIQTLEPFEQTLVSDGCDLWTIDLDVDQAVVRSLEADLKQVPILMFNATSEEITSEYQVDWFEADNLEHFVLSPLSIDALFEVLTISFDGSMPMKISIRDSLGQLSEIKFTETRLNPDLDDSVYVPVLPDGIDLIDDR